MSATMGLGFSEEKLEEHEYAKASALAFRRHAIKLKEENVRLRAALTEIARTPARADVTAETMFTHVRLLAQKALDFSLEQSGDRKP